MWALSYPYVGPILPLCRPIVSTNLLELGQNSFDLSFFPFRGTPWTPKPRKTRRFLTTPRWNSDTPKATKHRKTRCFLTPRTKNTLIYRGSRGSEVSPRWRWGEPPRGRRQGRHATITFGYQPKASGKGTGQRPSSRPAPGFKGYRPCRRPLSWAIWLKSWCPLWWKRRSPENVTQPSPDKLQAATSRRWTQNSQTPPKSGLRRSKKPSSAACRNSTFGTPKGEETSPIP